MDVRVFIFPYREEVGVPFARRDDVTLRMSVQPFLRETSMDQAYDLIMRLIHDKLVFGMDPFLLGQADILKLGTIDNFPLNVQ